MGEVKLPGPVKLFCGLIFKNEPLLSRVKAELVEICGAIDFESEIFAFDFTDYYAAEMGSDLKRQFISFSRPINPESLPEIKISSKKIENKFVQGENNCRRVNIDPGYIALEKVVLATSKNYSHRPYLGKGIYAELTYTFSNDSYQIAPWTYPDYRRKERIEMFNLLRKKHKKDLGRQ